LKHVEAKLGPIVCRPTGGKVCPGTSSQLMVMRPLEWNSLDEMRGNMSFQRIPNPAIYERESFRRIFQ
jgi:hypothetical protein